MQVQEDAFLVAKNPATLPTRSRLKLGHLVHIGQRRIVGVRQCIEITARTLGSGYCAATLILRYLVADKIALQTAADAPVLIATANARQINQADSFPIGFYQGQQATKRNTWTVPALAVPGPALGFYFENLYAFNKKRAQQPPPAGGAGAL